MNREERGKILKLAESIEEDINKYHLCPLHDIEVSFNISVDVKYKKKEITIICPKCSYPHIITGVYPLVMDFPASKETSQS